MRKSSPFDPSSSYDTSSANLTPLIDVVFILLVLFIFIAPLVHFDRIALADGEHTPLYHPSHKKTLAIHVYADNAIALEGQRIPLGGLKNALQRLQKEFPEKRTLQLFCDERAAFGTYQQIKNSAESAGFEAIDLILR